MCPHATMHLNLDTCYHATMITHARVPTHVALTLLIREPFSQGMVSLLVTGHWSLVTMYLARVHVPCALYLVHCALIGIGLGLGLDWPMHWIGIGDWLPLDWHWPHAHWIGIGDANQFALAHDSHVPCFTTCISVQG